MNLSCSLYLDTIKPIEHPIYRQKDHATFTEMKKLNEFKASAKYFTDKA